MIPKTLDCLCVAGLDNFGSGTSGVAQKSLNDDVRERELLFLTVSYRNLGPKGGLFDNFFSEIMLMKDT